MCHYLNSLRGQKLQLTTSAAEKHIYVIVLRYKKKKKGLSSSSVSVMNNKTYCITQSSHLELVYFKTPYLSLFYYLLILILKFHCIFKATIA